MFGPNHYVPILKSKRAEFKALSMLKPKAQLLYTPLFEFVGQVEDEDKMRRSIEQFAERLLNFVGTEHKFFVDLKRVNLSISVGGHSLTQYLFEELRRNQLKAIPVTGLSRDLNYQSDIRRVHSTDKLGICLRLTPADFTNTCAIESLIYLLDCSASEVDLIIDLGHIDENMLPLLKMSVIDLLSRLPSLLEYRTFTLAGSSFPSSMGNVSTYSVTYIPRVEWELWKHLYLSRSSLPRIPSFSDYGVDNPNPLEDFDPRTMKISANIRYTCEENWIIFKGGDLRKGKGHDQYFDLACDVTHHTCYAGPDFSWGDARILSYAKKEPDKGGTPGTWREIAYNHHIEYVIHQISNLSWP